MTDPSDATPTDLGAPKDRPIAPAPDDKPQPTVLPPGTRQIVVDTRPRLAWPDVFVYRWTTSAGEVVDTGLPPPYFAVPKSMANGIEALCPPYQIEILDFAAYERLRQDGWLQDERHTGRSTGTITDVRKAPGA